MSFSTYIFFELIIKLKIIFCNNHSTKYYDHPTEIIRKCIRNILHLNFVFFKTYTFQNYNKQIVQIL